MSDTPRTDAQVFTVDVAFTSHDGLASEPKNVVEPEFARELERENVALRADVLEQCMLNAKGSEREYSLRGRIEQLERENVALRKENVKLRQVLEGQSDEIRTLHIANDAAFAALDAARAKEAKP